MPDDKLSTALAEIRDRAAKARAFGEVRDV